MINFNSVTNEKLMDGTMIMLSQRKKGRDPILTTSYETSLQDTYPEFDLSSAVAVAADGGCIGYNPSPVGGMWAFCLIDAHDRRIFEGGGIIVTEAEAKRVARDLPSYMVPPPYINYNNVSNNISELLALTLAIESLPEGFRGAVLTDSKITRGRLFFDWAWENVTCEIRERAEAAVLKHGGKVNLFPILLAGHPSEAELKTGRSTKRDLPVSIHNKWCDEYCRAISAWYMETYQVPPLPMRPPRVPRIDPQKSLSLEMV